MQPLERFEARSGEGLVTSSLVQSISCPNWIGYSYKIESINICTNQTSGIDLYPTQVLAFKPQAWGKNLFRSFFFLSSNLDLNLTQVLAF